VNRFLRTPGGKEVLHVRSSLWGTRVGVNETGDEGKTKRKAASRGGWRGILTGFTTRTLLGAFREIKGSRAKKLNCDNIKTESLSEMAYQFLRNHMGPLLGGGGEYNLLMALRKSCAGDWGKNPR